MYQATKELHILFGLRESAMRALRRTGELILSPEQRVLSLVRVADSPLEVAKLVLELDIPGGAIFNDLIPKMRKRWPDETIFKAFKDARGSGPLLQSISNILFGTDLFSPTHQAGFSRRNKWHSLMM